MAWSKNYTISTDVTSGEVGPGKLVTEINAAITSATCTEAKKKGDTLAVTYDMEPSAGDKTTADSTVDDHTPDDSAVSFTSAGDYTISGSVRFLAVDNSSACTITLPAPADSIDETFYIKKVSSTGGGRDVTVDVSGGANIDDDTSATLTAKNTTVALYSTGSSYKLI